MESTYLDAARERVLVYDGATGTNLQLRNLNADDFGGAQLEGCNEMLVLTRPDVVADVHRDFLDVGVDAIETNTFGAFAIPLNEYAIGDRAHEINVAAARIAKEVASSYDNERWVAGSIGPGTKMPSLGHIRFADLRDAYEVQARGLLEGGVDLFLIETQYDLLGAKAAIIACRRAMQSAGRQIPLQLQVTIELTGRMLPGTEIGAAYTALRAMNIDVIGINCATGPAEMNEHLRYLSQHSDIPLACLPNAGLPSVVDGKMHYDLTPEELAAHHRRFVSELGINIVGGCCGTTPEYLRQVVDAVRDVTPATREPSDEPAVASLYSPVPLRQELSYLAIGERTNANGSKKFREAMLAGDLDTCVAMAGEQIAEGAHVLDLCVDYVGRDGTQDMDQIAALFGTQASAPVVLDSTEPQVMEAGLMHIGGRAILNSANLEDGEHAGSRLDRVFKLAHEHGAAVIVLLIDEEGQARDVEWKMRIAHRIHDLAVNRYGLEASDLIFDALTFPLSTGDDDLRNDAIYTIEAIRRIKTEIPGAHTVLGLSNVSFGLSPAIRHVLNSVFLYEAQQAGLDAAIVHAARIMPMHKIDERAREVCLDLIYNRKTETYDPLSELLSMFEGVKATSVEKEDRSGWPVGDRLKQRIIDGDHNGVDADLDEAMAEGKTPLDIINTHLLDGMKVVGELFGAGEMQLPFVLKSAETMKRSVAYLEPFMERSEDGGKGKIVLATVKGDVHDIGKNLVDIILTNNGYEVHNLGIKIAINEMIDKALEVNADIIGMSGLLVKSTLIMRENLEELNARELQHIPVILGGAALNRTYVERDLREVYNGRVFYGKDAFEGLETLDKLMDMKRNGPDDPDWGRKLGGRNLPRRQPKEVVDPSTLPSRSPEIETDNEIYKPPFLGSRIERGIALDEIAQYVNETALFRNQWQYRPEKGETDAEFKTRIRPQLRAAIADAKRTGVLVPQVAYGYWAANSDGNDLVIWNDESRGVELTRFPFPRQSKEPYMCIADFFRPKEQEVDYAAFHIVTMSSRVSEETAKLFAENKYQEYLFLHGLGVEMAEALAEYWHHRVRTEWGFVDQDGPTLAGLFRQQYRGGRYSWGYPACPDLEDNVKVAELLGADRIGVECSEESSFQYHPEQTTSALICHHPKAKYFVAG